MRLQLPSNPLTWILFILFCGCSSPQNRDQGIVDAPVTKDTIRKEVTQPAETPVVPDTSMVNIRDYSDKFAYDMRYATSNNFLKEKVYDCDNCLMRYEVAKALMQANDSLITLGYRIKFFDCFRPREVQKKMWLIVSDSRYVANPNKGGSIHNKGAALDITLVRLDGTDVDMGTDFDHFGEEAHHEYSNLPKEILDNRILLKNVTGKFGFKPLRTEWWHYTFDGKFKYNISDAPLCD